MPPTIRPVVVTHDIERLRRFYTSLLGAEENFRYPEDGRCSTSASGSATPSWASPPTPTWCPVRRAGCC